MVRCSIRPALLMLILNVPPTMILGISWTTLSKNFTIVFLFCFCPFWVVLLHQCLLRCWWFLFFNHPSSEGEFLSSKLFVYHRPILQFEKKLIFFFPFVRSSSGMGVRRRTRPIDDFVFLHIFWVFFFIGCNLPCGHMSEPGGSAMSCVSDEGTQRTARGGREAALDALAMMKHPHPVSSMSPLALTLTGL